MKTVPVMCDKNPITGHDLTSDFDKNLTDPMDDNTGMSSHDT
jgi:hypothetical protein